MYEVMKNDFFLCTVCYYKTGNRTGSDVVLIVGVLSYAVFPDFTNCSFKWKRNKQDLFSSRSHHSRHCEYHSALIRINLHWNV